MTMTVDRPDLTAERVLSTELEDELLKHPGKWIAMTPEKIVAIGDDSVVVYKAALKAGVTDAILYRVPEGGSVYFF